MRARACVPGLWPATAGGSNDVRPLPARTHTHTHTHSHMHRHARMNTHSNRPNRHCRVLRCQSHQIPARLKFTPHHHHHHPHLWWPQRCRFLTRECTQRQPTHARTHGDLIIQAERLNLTQERATPFPKKRKHAPKRKTEKGGGVLGEKGLIWPCCVSMFHLPTAAHHQPTHTG